MTEVTVIIPTYNRSEMVSKAIDSVIRQHFKDLEIIVVDDGSTEDVESIVKSKKDKRLKFLYNSINSGSSAQPRNMALEQASGKYIAFLDSDDIWDERIILDLHCKMNESACDIAYCGLVIRSESNEYVVHPMISGKLWPDMLGNCITSATCCLIKKECFDKVGFFDENKNMSPHWDMWIRLAKAGYVWDYIPSSLSIYIKHDGQYTMTTKEWKHIKNILDKYSDDYKKYPQEKKRAQHILGITYYNDKKYLHFLRYSLPVILSDKRNTDDYIRFVKRKLGLINGFG